MEAKPNETRVEPAKAAVPETKTAPANISQKAETTVQPGKLVETPPAPPQVAQTPATQTHGATSVEEQAKAKDTASPSPATLTEPPKPKESELKPALDDFSTNIFYFTGMGSLIGSALASGVYVPETTQRNAIEAEAVEEARARQSSRGGDGVIVTARHQAQGLSSDFRQLQTLLESLPTFTDAPEGKPYDRRAVDEPIHAHIYFSQKEKQPKQRSQAQSEPDKITHSSNQDQNTAGKDNRTSQNGGAAASSFDQQHRLPDAVHIDGYTQYPFATQNGGTRSQYGHPRHPLPPDTALGGGFGSDVLDSIGQFDRAFGVDASKSSNLTFGSAPRPTATTNRHDAETTPTIRQYPDAADRGGTRGPTHQDRPGSSSRPHSNQGGGAHGNVDSTGIKSWQLSHLRSLEAKGYNIVSSEQEMSFTHSSSHYGSDSNRGSGVRSPYQQKEVLEHAPAVAVTSRTTGSINHPYAASLEMPYCDL